MQRTTFAAVLAGLLLPAALAACGGDPESASPGTGDSGDTGEHRGTSDSTETGDTTDTADQGTSAGTGDHPHISQDSTPDCDPATAEGELILPSPQGAIEGGLQEDVRRWLGVPYAAAPIGERRWQTPATAECRTRVIRADRAAPFCPQRTLQTGELLGQEDCLHLNIWAPAEAPPSEGWPVLVFIHGGGNIIGAASQRIGQSQQLVYDGAALARQGLVVITINYRLGALGWLALPELSSENDGRSGNWALQDQQFALRWIHEHVPAIGGDTDRLMVFGESAGAVNTIAHLASPGSAGLFQAAGIMSGAPSARLLEEAESYGADRASESACGGFQEEERLECLRGLSVEEVLDAFPGQLFVGGTAVGAGTGSNFGPVVDGAVLTGMPRDVIAAGEHNDVPVLIGTTAEEMAELLNTQGVEEREDLERVVRQAFGVFFGEAGVERILEAYPEDEYQDARQALIALYSDFRFVCSALLMAEALDAGGSSPVFRYWFQRRAETAQGTLPAAHGRELVYLFESMYLIPFFSPAEGDRAVARQMVEAWVSMATGLVPEVDGGPVWQPWEPARDNAFVFDVPPEIMEGVRAEQCAMWRDLTGL